MKHTIKNTTSRGERIFGWIYIFLQQLILVPPIVVFTLLDITVSDMWLNMLYFATNFLLIMIIYRRFLVKNLQAMGRNIGNNLISCLLGFVVYWSLNIMVSLVIVTYFPDFSNANDSYIMSMTKDNFWIMFLGTVVLVPIVEETLFRGVVFGSLCGVNRPLAYVLSVLLFSAIHIVGYIGADGYTLSTALVSLMQYLPASICLAWVYDRTNTIFAPTLVHMTVNAIGMLAMR